MRRARGERKEEKRAWNRQDVLSFLRKSKAVYCLCCERRGFPSTGGQATLIGKGGKILPSLWERVDKDDKRASEGSLSTGKERKICAKKKMKTSRGRRLAVLDSRNWERRPTRREPYLGGRALAKKKSPNSSRPKKEGFLTSKEVRAKSPAHIQKPSRGEQRKGACLRLKRVELESLSGFKWETSRGPGGGKPQEIPSSSGGKKN